MMMDMLIQHTVIHVMSKEETHSICDSLATTNHMTRKKTTSNGCGQGSK